MNFKPSDLFIGVIDFFSVICPGALITYFFIQQITLRNIDLSSLFPPSTNETQKGLVFLLTTYIAGNLIFPIAAVLDKTVYKRIREKFLTKNGDVCYLKATEISEKYLCSGKWIDEQAALPGRQGAKQCDEKKIINTYKWSQHFIAIKQPDMLNEVKKLEADSKFFRSLVVVFLIMFLIKILHLAFAACFLGLALLSLYRYADMRYKANERAFEIVITIEADNNVAKTV